MSKPLQTSFNRLVAILGVALIVATVVVLATSGKVGGGSSTAASTGPAKAVDKVEIKDFKFAPPAITVAVGTTVTWTNTDSSPHTATSGASPSADGVFDTDIIKQGQSKTVKLSKAGTFTYYCALHPFMQATVTVR